MLSTNVTLSICSCLQKLFESNEICFEYNLISFYANGCSGPSVLHYANE